MSKIKAVIAELPTYGYRRVHAVLKRQALAVGLKPPNHKRVYRVMKVHGLLLDRHVGGDERRHDGRIAVDERNRRWCSDGFEIGCELRVPFELDRQQIDDVERGASDSDWQPAIPRRASAASGRAPATRS